MKLSSGAKWGAATGAIAGAISDVWIYLNREQLAEAVRQALASSGVPLTPSQIDQAVQFAISTTYIAAIVGGVIVYVIIGLIMAAVWDKLKMPWFSIGAIFGLALSVIAVASGFAAAAPASVPGRTALSVAEDFAFSLLLAYLMGRFGR